MGTRIAASLVGLALVLLPPLASALEESSVAYLKRSVSVYIPAVAKRDDGTFVGVLSVLTLTAQQPGRGDVFVRTEPLAEVDMQGAARLAVAAAGELTGTNVREWDYFFTITTNSPTIGGPSGGGAMATVTAAILMNWALDSEVGMTGMINPDLSIGPVGGILRKAEALSLVHIHTFLIPAGQRFQTETESVTAPDGTTRLEQRTVDNVEEAKARWGMRVVEVEDLYDVIPRFTGIQLQRPTTSVDPVQHAAYQNLMANASAVQGQGARSQHDQAQAAYDRLRDPMGSSDRGSTEQALAASAQALERSQNATQTQHYYQASSFNFQSLVNSRYAQALLGFYDQNASAASYTGAYIDAGAAELEATRPVAATAYPLTASAVGAQAALEMRLAEASRLVTEGRTDLSQGKFADALRVTSFARERLGSATSWATVRDRVAPLSATANVTREGLAALAREYEASATLMFAYAKLIVDESGADDQGRIQEANLEIGYAQDALDAGADPAALYGFVRAISQINAAMAGLNPVASVAQRLDSIESRAAFEIEVARTAGVEPVFAVSQFEFAQSQQASSPIDAYEGFTVARMAARATLVVAGYQPPPVEQVPGPFAIYTPLQRTLQGVAWAVLAFAGLPAAFGLALAGVLAASPFGRGKLS